MGLLTNVSIDHLAQNTDGGDGTAKRMRRSPEDARRLILDTAQVLVARTGPEGLRLQDIATAAGISHPLILHHFGSRAGLVRALARRATSELRDRLIAAANVPDHTIEAQIDRVFDALRDGLAQLLAWLAAQDGDGEGNGSTMIMREIVDTLYARRAATAPPGVPVKREDIEWMTYLITTAAFGDAIYGKPLRRSAGLAEGAETDRRFRAWLAALIRERHRQ
jgi:AcrR family transcriptional regulator